MSDETDPPRPRPVEVREVVEPPSPWLPVKDVVVNLLLVFGGSVLFWFVVDRLDAPMWVAFVALTVVWVAGTVVVRLFRRRSAASADA
ncbi:hypothetical protein ES689_06315 [Frigoribacterium sp. ACAM 257]|uniref:hypothetical protein n=1 Tax=Frigoribacterium sp. ACAM 257 TaxID=2508998 RepID=UPI0011B9C836|nr:hypothetical protein [Frigoribacterium sp. ACAM 257]TWX38285.1 hypothetical protein ES689_06315 [Frigoribacterium sp. ACAM 257]